MPGSRQRLAAHAASGPALAHSLLALHLLELIFWGSISPQQAQKLAKCGCDDIEAAGGESLIHLQQMAAIGSFGKFPNNMNRDLQGLLHAPKLPTSSVHSAAMSSYIGAWIAPMCKYQRKGVRPGSCPTHRKRHRRAQSPAARMGRCFCAECIAATVSTLHCHHQ